MRYEPSEQQSPPSWRRISAPDPGVSTTTLSGHIVTLTEDAVVILPERDRAQLIEIRRANVLDFAVSPPTGTCHFLVPASALVQEVVTMSTISRRTLRAGELNS